MTFNVLNFDTKADRVADDTPAIQAAIDVCSKAGDGRVALEGGKYFYPGSTILEENMGLHLERGVMLRAHKALECHFHPSAGQRNDGVERVGTPVTPEPSYVFIYARGADNIAISEEGAVDGNAYILVRQVSPYYVTGDFYPRPTLVYAKHCNHISFRDITMRNAPFWALHPTGYSDALISDLQILNGSNVANSDGIDLDHSTNMRIVDCHATCVDDCIYLKGSSGDIEYRPFKNIIISGHIPMPTSVALKIGTEGTEDFEDVVVDNCIISDSNRGTPIQIRDGENVRNVSFSNVIIEARRFAEHWWGCTEPITMSIHDRDKHTKSGYMSSVRFSNITYDPKNDVFLSGSRGNHIKDILFEDVHVMVRAKNKWPKGMYDLRPGHGQRIEGIKTSESYIRRADHVILWNYQAKFEGEEKNDFSHALYAEEYRGMTLKDFRGQTTSSDLENVVTRQDKP